jgi:transcriptional regulator of arginine metabolism
MVASRIKRIGKITDVLKSKSVATQEDLVNELKRQGIIVTQATLSRDLAEIGAIRVHEKDKIYYKFPENEEAGISKQRSISLFEVKEMLYNETLVIIKTISGCAQSVAAAIDSWNHPDILGTLGGDDTIMIIPKKCKDVKKIYKSLREKLEA